MNVLERCRAGDAAAWKEVFATWTPRVYRWAVFLGLRASDAEDAAQEVLATAARRIETCTDPQAVNLWLYQITRRIVANARRVRWWRLVISVAEPLEPAFAAHSETACELELSVRECLAELPRAQREILVLAEIEGFSRREVAVLLDVPEGTVAGRLRAARESFKRSWRAGSDRRPCPRLSWEEP